MSELSLSVAGLLSQHLPSEVVLTGRNRGPGVNPAPQLGWQARQAAEDC